MTDKKTSQASMEYLLVIALTFAIIVPTAYLFYSYSKESSQEISDAQITKIGKSIVDTSSTIFYSGSGSKTVLELNMPSNINSADIIDERELVFNVRTDFGSTDVVFFSSVPIKKADADRFKKFAESGLKKVKIEAIKEGAKDTIIIDII